MEGRRRQPKLRRRFAQDGRGALADIDGAIAKRQRPSRASVMRMLEGLGSEVLPQPYHIAASADAARKRGSARSARPRGPALRSNRA
jgi:hypothetical protein